MYMKYNKIQKNNNWLSYTKSGSYTAYTEELMGEDIYC